MNNEDYTNQFNYNSPISTVIPAAIQYCVDNGAKVINISVGVGYSPAINSAIEAAWSAGVTIICSAGNSGGNVVYPANHPKTIAVTATNENDLRWDSGWGAGNFGIHLDVAAPGTNITSSDQNGVITQHNGTSFSAPVVSGIVALMLSVNPCLSPEQIRQILRSTSEKVGGYNYNYDFQKPGRSDELGFGRVNAHLAVLAAQNMINQNSDLYVRDHHLDYGPDACYPWTWDFDESPDIWVRNTNDGLIEQTHSNYVHFYNSLGQASDKYVYVRVTNSGCTPSNGTETVVLNASAAGSSTSWPDGWNLFGQGGQLIGSAPIPALEPGESTIVEILWDLMYNTNSCILARIENEASDPIGTLPSDISLEIWGQNNIALRNVVIYDFGPMFQIPYYDGKEVSHGNVVTFTNPGQNYEEFDFEVFTEMNAAGNYLTDEAEVTLTFNDASWALFQNNLANNPNARIIKDKTVLVNGTLQMNNIELNPGEQFTCYLGVTFLTKQLEEEDIYEINFVQKYSTPHPVVGDHWTGGLHFKIVRNDRALFLANAGSDQLIDIGETSTLTAVSIGEEARYNWSVLDGAFIANSQSINVKPKVSTTYQLEVVTQDGFKDYDEVTVTVNQFKLSSIVPNPASGACVIDYVANDAVNARLDIIGISNSNFSSVPLSTTSNSVTVDLSSLPPGVYSVILVCNNELQDVLQLSVY